MNADVSPRLTGVVPRFWRLIASTLGVLCAVAAAQSATVPPVSPRPSAAEITTAAVRAGEKTWTNVQALPPTLSSREIFCYALALCESGQHLDRLDKLFETAAKMQDRDPSSRGFGNFRWSWGHPAVLDFNAVDFCMQAGSLIWLRHQERLTPAVRARLKEILEFAGEGLMRHRVRESYTNIALMNAANLIVLGEAMGRANWADEGYARLTRVLVNTWQEGTHEYCSPTYYGVDLDDLVLLEAFCRRPEGKLQVRALLELFWTDVAMNFFPPAAKLAGAHSRDYDYLRGLGPLDQHLAANGWLLPSSAKVTTLWPALAQWHPAESFWEKSHTLLPRLVTQSWGKGAQTRTHYLCPDVTLSSSEAGYGGRMDLPLTADLPGRRETPRCYFIPDGRHDPYGKIKIAESQAHEKTLHLAPFWAATQRRVDALGLAVYREKDLGTSTGTLESHFVMPLDADAFWVGDRRVEFTATEEAEFPVAPGAAVVLRKGTAAVGVRVPYAIRQDGKPAPTSLIYDKNPYGAVRLTASHHSAQTNALAAAAFWVRIGTALDSDTKFNAWRRAFAAAAPVVRASDREISIEAPGVDGSLAIRAEAPFQGEPVLSPPPTHPVLAVNGEDVGRKILEQVEPLKSLERVKPLHVGGQPLYSEAEAGRVLPSFQIDSDAAASGGRYVWVPGAPGAVGRTPGGSLSWPLNVAAAGKYYLWGRVLALTPSDDSFMVRILGEKGELSPMAAWQTGIHKTWAWVPVKRDGATDNSFDLPSGPVTLEITPREDGTKLDRLFLNRNADGRP